MFVFVQGFLCVYFMLGDNTACLPMGRMIERQGGMLIMGRKDGRVAS